MANFYVLLYPMYSVLKKSATEGRLQRSRVVVGLLHGLRGLVRRGFLPKAKTWVQIQSGFSKGLWMQVYLPGEVSLWHGEHEPEVQNAIAVFVRPGAVFYDVGAQVGTMTLGTARLVGESGRVIAFDGDPENVERLLVNSEKNEFQARIRVVHGAVWSRTASDGIPFRRGAATSSHGGVEADGNYPVLGNGEIIRVPAITLDDFIAAGAPSPQLIKIDVEGGEYEVLQGADRLFTVQRPFIIVEVHRQKAADRISAWLDEYKYCSHWKIPKETFPRRLFAWPTEQDGATWMRARLDQESEFNRPAPPAATKVTTLKHSSEIQ
jgi:FkbM family methyltransferase